MAKKKSSLSTGKIIMYAAGAGAIIGTGYVGYNFLRDLNIGGRLPGGNGTKETEGGSTSSDATNGSVVSASLPKPTYHDAFPMEVGDKNWYVQQMQLALINHGGKAKELIEKSGGADGVFGEGTLDALVEAKYVGILDRYIGAKVYDVTYERILNKGSLSGLSGLGVSPKVAITTKQTFLVTAESIRQSEPQAYPVKEGITVGYLMNEKEGLSKIQTHEGDICYTISSGIKVM